MEKDETEIMKGLKLSIKLIEKVHIPLEKENTELKMHFEKFKSMVKNSMEQVIGTRNIILPSEIPKSVNELKNNNKLYNELEALLSQWAQTMRNTIENELKKPINCKDSLGVIEYWRLRYSVLNMLYQELTKPKVEEVRKLVSESNDSTIRTGNGGIEEFEEAKKQLGKLNGEAKDNVKFLNTLETQFKKLQNEDLNNIEQSLAALFNGLKLVFVISRHFKSEERISSLLAIISNEICDKVEKVLSFKNLFKEKPSLSSEQQLDKTINMIESGKKVLNTLISEFERTKEKLEEDQGDRWDFDPKPIKDRPSSMFRILDHFKKVAIKLKKYFSFLGPKLKAVVTGNSEKIDELIDNVKDITKDFENVSFNVYDKNCTEQLDKIINQYNEKLELMENKTKELIETTFKDLRSSESAFELLQEFKNLENLKHVSEQLKNKYSNVLETYKKELEEIKQIFNEKKNEPNFGKDKPPITSAISWKRALFYRVKRPIIKFNKNPEEWNQAEFQTIKEEYKAFAIELDDYENQKLNQWSFDIENKAISLLKKKILERDENGKFYVSFKDEFKELISEARNLDKMGFALNKTIYNITLQEKEYYKIIDKLKKILNDYNKEVENLSDVERELLSDQIELLNIELSSVAENFNLHSLGIMDFIDKFKQKLKRFVELKNKIEEKKRMIEDIVNKISSTELISRDTLRKFFKQQIEAKDFMNLTNFSFLISNDIETHSKELVEKYLKIGSTMLPQIKLVINSNFKKSNSENEKMKMQIYLMYWERRIYNALLKMITRGLLTFKELINRKGFKPSPLFKVSTEFQYKKVVTVPHVNEIRVTVNNLVKKIKDVACKFPRWKEGTFETLNIESENINSNDLAKMTFLKDINDNRVIKIISMELSELKKMTFSRIEKYKTIWEEEERKKDKDKDQPVFRDSFGQFKEIIGNQKLKFKIEKMIEKNPTIANYEFFIEYFDEFSKKYEQFEQEKNAGFIRINFSNVKNQFIRKCKESLDHISGSFLKLANKQKQNIEEKIENFNESLNQDASSLLELKSNLNTIQQIKEETMNIELDIEEIVEKFRILDKFQLRTEVDSIGIIKNLKKKWKNLLLRVSIIYQSLKDKKEIFDKKTKAEISKLQDRIKVLYNEFEQNGPGSFGIDLDTGLLKIDEFQIKMKKMIQEKTELVSSEKLFADKVSTFPILTKIEEEMMMLEELYSFYRNIKEIIRNWSKVLWSKLDFESFVKDKKKLNGKINIMKKKKNFNKEIFTKIKQKVDEFNSIFPLIEKLKANPDFKEVHWEKLMKDIGISTSDINFKMITLKQVFSLNLQKYSSIVDEIVIMASQEAQNQLQIREIEIFWKNSCFDLKDYKKGEEKRGIVLKVDEEIYNKLNEHLVNLQNMESSKHAYNLKTVIREWVDNLNRVQETIDIWMEVQKKWIYLEGIFIGNEDIRQQLKNETKKFEGFHKSFRKLNQQVFKNKNIFVNCVTIDSTITQLSLLKGNFDKSQKSLTNYLESKKECFPRFYFITNDDLLGILGSSNTKAVKPHLSKLFDNCKSFLTTRTGTIKGNLI